MQCGKMRQTESNRQVAFVLSDLLAGNREAFMALFGLFGRKKEAEVAEEKPDPLVLALKRGRCDR